MSISAISAYAPPDSCSGSRANGPAPGETGSFSKILDSCLAPSEASTFEDIVSKYDITNMSRNEADDMFRELFGKGLVSLRDILHASLDPTHIPGWQDGISSISGWKMTSDPDAKMDYLEGFRTQAAWNRTYGDPQFQQNYDRMLELAERIQDVQHTPGL